MALAFAGGLLVGGWLYRGSTTPTQATQTSKVDKVASDQQAKNDSDSPGYADKIQLLSVKARWVNSFSGRSVGVDIKVKNKGDRTVKTLTITVFFLDSDGNAVHEDDFTIANQEGYGQTVAAIYDLNVDPIKPNYIRYLQSLEAKNVPNEWKEGAVSAKIKTVELE